MRVFLLLLLLATSIYSSLAQDMSNEELQKIIKKQSDSIQDRSRLGYWQFHKEDVLLICVTDTKANRMRIMSPITKVEQLNNELLLNSLTANFHTALDVKYAISDNILWSVFIHPLKELATHQVEDAISQVYYANLTFGYTYSSTNLVFPGKKENSEKQKDTNNPKTKH
ncbi:hypothetical protein [Pseudofulvibacter geojedonensis]|uniref:Uncharacterized protein n=1 Tax=Pseudofulvibacter geojedonensis TaxID=1123758 RepID=A0ABW3HY13_9FLAO